MEKNFIHKKLEFLVRHIELLKEYKDFSLEDLGGRIKDLKYVEKLIQELVDCAIDINQFILENAASEKPWSSKQSFWDLGNKVLKKYKIGWSGQDLKLLVDSVSFRNEIVHSYDVNVYIIWSKRDIKTIVGLYSKYCATIMSLLKKL